MKDLKEFLISFSGLKEGKHPFRFEVKDTFFDCFEYSEIKHGNASVDAHLHKHSTFIELELFVEGKIEIMCDRCTDNYFQEIKGERKIVVKYGEEFLDEGDDLIILPQSETNIDVAGLIYEMIVLATPSKRVHPGGECNEETLKALENIRIDEAKEEQEDAIDPRWEALKKLK